MRLLFFQINPASYASYFYFSEELSRAMRNHGHETVFFRSSEEELPAMERFSGQTFDAIIDFNSDLPKVTTDQDTFFLDTIRSPFINVILDHPLYHHNILKQKLNNYHVVCLDENHANYIRTFYPHIKSVTLIPMTGSAASPPIPFEERDIPFLFTGSYTSPTEVEEAISHIPAFMQEDVYALIERIRKEPSMTIEAAAKELFSGTVVDEYFALHLQSYFLADTWLRAYERHRILDALVRAKIPMKICGNGYEKAPFYDVNSGVFMPERTFSETFTLMNHAKLCLNILPLFQNGVHDRIFSAMLNGSAVLTDASEWIRQHLHPGQNLFLYDPWNPEALPGQISELLAKEDGLYTTAENGRKEAFLHHTWEKRALSFENLIQNLI